MSAPDPGVFIPVGPGLPPGRCKAEGPEAVAGLLTRQGVGFGPDRPGKPTNQSGVRIAQGTPFFHSATAKTVTKPWVEVRGAHARTVRAVGVPLDNTVAIFDT